MPDNSLVTMDSKELRLCYVVKDDRMGWNENHVEIGPSFLVIDKEIRNSSNNTLGVPIPGQTSGLDSIFTTSNLVDGRFEMLVGFRDIGLC